MFEKQKKRYYEIWLEAKRNKEVDDQIIGLIELINSLPNYYTTSSCFGRITLAVAKPSSRKYDHYFLAKWHYLVSWEEFRRIVKIWEERIREDFLWLKVYPFILHLSAKTMEDAKKILEIGLNSGMKESGIFEVGKRIMVRIEGVDRLELPLGNDGFLLVSEKYLKYLYLISKIRFLRNLKKVIKFTFEISKEFFKFKGEIDLSFIDKKIKNLENEVKSLTLNI